MANDDKTVTLQVEISTDVMAKFNAKCLRTGVLPASVVRGYLNEFIASDRGEPNQALDSLFEDTSVDSDEL
jgi:hypothetical protein